MHTIYNYISPIITIILFIYGLFNDAVNSSDYIASNDRVTNEL
jgi:hypothetical protein